MPHLGAFVPSNYFAFIYVPVYSVGRLDHIAGMIHKPGRILFYGREVDSSYRFNPLYDKDGYYDLLRGEM